MQSLRRTLRTLLWKAGFDVVRFKAATHALARRQRILESHGITLILDVGADIGQFAQDVRATGYQGRIVSFEPRRAAHKALTQLRERDPSWDVVRCALGSSYGTADINVAGNMSSSSLLGMLPAHVASAPDSRYVGTETVELRPLDAMFGDLCTPRDRVYLKIDTQGYEAEVLKGAERSLSRIALVQLEVSLVPLYRDQPLFHEMHAYLEARGYSLMAIEPGFSDERTGQLLQFDAVYNLRSRTLASD